MKIRSGQTDLTLGLYFRLQTDSYSLQDTNIFRRFIFKLKSYGSEFI